MPASHRHHHHHHHPPFLLLLLSFFLLLLLPSSSATDSSDLSALQSLLSSISNPSILSSWTGSDPCSSNWKYVTCSGPRVTQLQFGQAGLFGRLPSNFNLLSNLQQLALQGNFFSGPLPSFNGLSSLTTAYLGNQNFSSIPSDFFHGLTSLTTLSLENNPLNSTTGWSLSDDLSSASSLTYLSLTNTSLTGFIPAFLGNMTSLQELRLAYNQLNGTIPASFNGAKLARLELNNQILPGVLSGPIDVVGTMQSLGVLWLQGNSFSGTIPASLGSAVSLQECRLNDNKLVGQIPSTFSSSSSLQFVEVGNNMLDGSLPSIPSITNSSSYIFSGNLFCQSVVGEACAPEVYALLSFLSGVNYPTGLVQSWAGNNPCASWQGITCDAGGKSVISINLPNAQLTGTISPDVANITSLTKLVLSGNSLTGTIPSSLTTLKFLVLIDVSNNNIYGPVPAFNSTQVKLVDSGNANINNSLPAPSPTATGSTSSGGSTSGSSLGATAGKASSSHTAVIVTAVVVVVAVLFVGAILAFLVFKKRRHGLPRVQSPNTVYMRPDNGGDNADIVKITVNGNTANVGAHEVRNHGDSGPSDVKVLEAGNLVISIQVLRNVTNDFSESKILGKGGFGVVYKGELDDGTNIAVKRMLASVVSNKAQDEFQAEIAVLTKVRHRHLVALLGYCIEGNERLLVYEYMPLGTLSQHVFEWKRLELPPLDWKKRLSIALDVARGVEYLHGLAHKSFIHRDLKPSNILLGDDYRAKVSDFGLVKLAPEGKFSVETRLAGTFGYLAPEYAVTGRVTTKADVFSFGVVLMELITGRKALDETQPEESMHLVTWFRRLLSNKEALLKSVDSVLEVTDETSQSICIVAELAGHCTAREPYQRPDMSHAVNVLSPLVEQWKPTDMDGEDGGGIDLDMTLPQALKKWQAFEGSSVNGYASIASMPACPSGLANTFASTDGR